MPDVDYSVGWIASVVTRSIVVVDAFAVADLAFVRSVGFTFAITLQPRELPTTYDLPPFTATPHRLRLTVRCYTPPLPPRPIYNPTGCCYPGPHGSPTLYTLCRIRCDFAGRLFTLPADLPGAFTHLPTLPRLVADLPATTH